MSEHLPPAGLNIRGTVLVVPGRGETALTYARFGRRLAADAYHVHILPTVPVSSGALATLNEVLTTAAAGADPAGPLVLIGSDTGAVLLAALLGASAGASPAAPVDASPGSPPGPSLGSPPGFPAGASLGSPSRPVWAPAGVVLAGLPGHERRHQGEWEAELDARSHCPVHRGLLTDDTAVTRGALSTAVPADLLDAAYGAASPVPHLLLIGESDPLADRDAVAGLAKSLPAARLATVRDAHHDVLNDTSHRSVAAEIITFLESLRSGPPIRPFVTVESSTW